MTYRKYPDEKTVNEYIAKKEPLTFAISSMGVPQIGESRTLCIDENNLGSYIEPIADKSARMIGYFISISFMIAGIITLVLSFAA